MNRKKLDEDKCVLLEIKSYDKEKVKEFLADSRIKDPVEFETNGKLHIAKVHVTQDVWDDDRHVYEGFAPEGLWVYEYRYDRGYLYHGGKICVIPSIDFTKSMEVLLEMNKQSILSGIETAFRVRVGFPEHKAIHSLLDHHDKQLYISIINYLHDFYVKKSNKRKFRIWRTRFDEELIEEIDDTIKDLMEHPHLVKYLYDVPCYHFLSYAKLIKGKI